MYNVEFEVLRAVVLKSTIFWDITPCSPLKVNRRFGGTYRKAWWQASLQHALTLVSCSAYFSTLKMEAICFSETLVDSQLITWRYVPEGGTIQLSTIRKEK
jgi:hypothetical protein